MPFAKGVIHEAHFSRAGEILFCSVKGGLRAQPSSRKTRPRLERLVHVAQPTALSRRVCPHGLQQLCWSWPVALWPPDALVRALSSFRSRQRRPAGGLPLTVQPNPQLPPSRCPATGG